MPSPNFQNTGLIYRTKCLSMQGQTPRNLCMCVCMCGCCNTYATSVIVLLRLPSALNRNGLRQSSIAHFGKREKPEFYYA